MNLLWLKGLSATAILAVTLMTGMMALRSFKRRSNSLYLGDALADGVFLGAAFFHLFPDAIKGFERIGILQAYGYTAVLIIMSYLLLMLTEKILTYQNQKHQSINAKGHSCNQ